MKCAILPLTSSIGGCCGKLESELLDEVLESLAFVQKGDQNILQDFSMKEDCAIYKINDKQSIAVSVDFMHPPILEADVFGEIAACNAISDIYTLGILPQFCLSILGIPDNVDFELINAIITSGTKIIVKAGAIVVGGHTIRNHDFICGYAAFSIINGDNYWNRKNIKPGDQIILTKPIGTGVVLGARKKGLISLAEAKEAIEITTALNDTPVKALKGVEVSGATDITGYGLIGHAYNLAASIDATFVLYLDSIPILETARSLYSKNVQTGLTYKNQNTYGGFVSTNAIIPDFDKDCLYDPQTSGGLLICIPHEAFDKALSQLNINHVFYKHVGCVSAFNGKHIEIV